jgi:hypothetical protein
MANKSPRGLSYPVVSACDLPAVIDIAGLSVIFAQRRESAHVAELPKKRATGKVCAEAANVFAVRVRSRRFGVTHGLREIVDAAPVHPTVRSAKRAEVDLEFADIYHRAAC